MGYNPKATPKEFLELKTPLGSTTKFQTVASAYKKERGLHAMYRVEEPNLQFGDDGKFFSFKFLNFR